MERAAIKKGTGLDNVLQNYHLAQTEDAAPLKARESVIGRLERKYLFVREYHDWIEQERILTMVDLWNQLRYLQPGTEEDVFKSLDHNLEQSVLFLLEKYDLANQYFPHSLLKKSIQDGPDGKVVVSLWEILDKLLGNEICTPNELDVFLQTTIQHEQKSQKKVLGWFLSKLVQRSYNLNYHNTHFIFHTQGLSPLDNFPYFIKGTASRPLSVVVDGPLGAECAHSLKYCAMTVRGDVGNDFGKSIKNSSLIIEGTVHGIAFNNAEHSSITLTRWESKEFSFVKKLIFRIRDEQTIDRIIGKELLYTGGPDYSAELYLLKNGREIRIGRWQRFRRELAMTFRGEL